jgi:hypothetical protein
MFIYLYKNALLTEIIKRYCLTLRMVIIYNADKPNHKYEYTA